MLKRRNLFIAGTVIGIALIAFIGISAWRASTGAAQTPGNAVVRVSEVAMTMKLDTTVVPEGKVTFLVVNQDKVNHEAVLLKTDKAPGELIMLAGENKVDEAALAENVGEVEVEAGTTGAGTFELAPGKYVLICNVVDHYKAGMYSAFEVKAAPPAAALNGN